MQRSCLILILSITGLVAQNHVEILPMSSYSAIQTLKENSKDYFQNSLAFFSLGLDEKAYEIICKHEPVDLEDRMRTYLLKTILAFRIGKFEKCLEHIGDLKSLGVWSSNLEKVYIGCLFSTNSWQEVVKTYEQSKTEKLDSESLFMVAKSAVKVGKVELAKNLLSKIPSEQRKNILFEIASTQPAAIEKFDLYFDALNPCLLALIKGEAQSNNGVLSEESIREIVKQCKTDG